MIEVLVAQDPPTFWRVGWYVFLLVMTAVVLGGLAAVFSWVLEGRR